jgi:hypothetical protein
MVPYFNRARSAKNKKSIMESKTLPSGLIMPEGREVVLNRRLIGLSGVHCRPMDE